MRGRLERAAFAAGSLPPLRVWLSRISGAGCFLAAGFAGVLAWRDPGAAAIAVVGLCALAGALLLSLPDYVRYVAALRETPPLPDRVDEAFERTYQDLAEMRQVLDEITEELARRRNAARAEALPGPDWVGEAEEALSRLRLDFDALAARLAPVLPDEGPGSKPLPAGMLDQALSRAGRGSKVPGGGGKDC